MRPPARTTRSTLALGIALALAPGCATTPEVVDPAGYELYEYDRELLGEPVRVRLWSLDAGLADAAAERAFRAVARVDLAAGDSSSIAEVRTLVSGGTWMPVSRELDRMIDRGVEIAAETNGAYDPTLGPLALLWRMARKNGRLPSEVDVNSARSRTGWLDVETAARARRVRLTKSNMSLDLSGLLRGAACDEALRALSAAGLDYARVDVGPVVGVSGPPPGALAWEVELPQHAGGGTIELVGGGLATSGLDEEWFDLDGVRYCRTIDATTGVGCMRRRLATVVAEDALTADAVSSALRATHGAVRRAELTLSLGVRAWVTEP